MRTALLNLISTPVPMLHSLGLEVVAGLSSEDPTDRRPSEPYEAYLTVYAPDGSRQERQHLGTIPPHRRWLVNLSERTNRLFLGGDHLAVVHRIPQRLLQGGRHPEDIVELNAEEADYTMFRSMVQFAFPGGAHGSLIYETPHGLNVMRPGRAPANTLTFTSKVFLSEDTTTVIALIHYSVDPGYRTVAPYTFAVFAPSGERVAIATRSIRPFSVELLDLKSLIPAEKLRASACAPEGWACFSYVGYSMQAVLIPLILNLSPQLKSVSVEHTHPAQTYLAPADSQRKYTLKARAVKAWQACLASEEPLPTHVDALSP